MPNLPALRPVNGLIPAMPPATISSALRWEIAAVRNGYDDAPKTFSAAVKAEAAALRHALAPWAATVPERVLREWLAPIANSTRNPHPNAGAWLKGAFIAVGTLECIAFTEDTQREAMRTFTFFPAVADVYAIVGPVASEFRQKMAALNQITEAPTTEAKS